MTSAKQSPTPHPSRTVPIPDTLESIKGYPDKLKIYQMAASSFWQVRFFDGKSTIKRSTGQTDKREAIKSAISFYEKLMINKHNGVAVIKNTRFDACANSFMQAQAARVTRKEISAESHQNDQYFLDGKVLPEFRELNIADINYDRLQKFVDKIGASLSGSSIQRYLGLIRKILDHAQNRDDSICNQYLCLKFVTNIFLTELNGVKNFGPKTFQSKCYKPRRRIYTAVKLFL